MGSRGGGLLGSGENSRAQSQILEVSGDWSGMYNTGGEPTLLEGLPRWVSKELGIFQ